MEIYELSPDGGVKRIEALPKDVRLVCAFGCFDGVHVGHQALLKKAVECSEKTDSGEGGEKYRSAVWTFSEPVSKPWVISVAERLSLCGRYGIRYALCQRFEDVRELSPEDFVEGLVRDCGLRQAVCGYNFRFGHKGAGDPVRLAACLRDSVGRLLNERADGQVSVVDEVRVLGEAVSSTRIRALLTLGETEAVEELLGRPYSVFGKVASGKQIGRTISRPTANIIFSEGQLIPRRGVYFTYCRVRGRLYRAVTNVGYRPTVNADPESVTCEAHLLDFSESVYGEGVEIIFVHYHRAEITFDSIEALSRQIADDVDAAVEYFDRHG